MAFELACWDLDGVIADSSRAIPLCINLALDELGIRRPGDEELRAFIGPPLLQTFRLLLEEAHRDAELARICVESYRRHYATESIRNTTAYPGVKRLLDRLQGRMRLAVVTSKPAEAAIPILTALEVRSCFEGVFAPALDELEEPKSETLRLALAALGIEPDRPAIMIGDRLHDIIAGKANGLATAGVLWGFGSAGELAAERPDYLVASVAELEAVLRPGS